MPQGKAPFFGDVIMGKMAENEFGIIVRTEWLKTAEIRPNITMDEFIVMPDHIHGIIVIGDSRRGTAQHAPMAATTINREQFGKPTSDSIPTIVRLFKSTTTRQINEMRRMPGVPVWQRNYYERIICDPESFYRIRRHINDNPRNWLNKDSHRFPVLKRT